MGDFDLTGRSAGVTGAAADGGAFGFLASGPASSVTGQVLPVDGGMVM